MALNLVGPEEQELRARITVFGVGGAGGNAVNNMIEKSLEGVDFIAANTDAQALKDSKAPRKIQLGIGVTRGLGAGSKPEVGQRAAEETREEIVSHLDGSHMCFITAGMGGGTGTGAAPTVAHLARDMGILTVGVVTKPFDFEGARRMEVAKAGLEEMQQVVDTLIVIPNQNLFMVANEHTSFVEAFQMADNVLYQGVQGVTDLMVRPGMINLDFADVRSVMEEMGKAMMGTGEADGQTRAKDAAEAAIANPLLDEISLKGARGVLINITGGYDLKLMEVDEAANRIKKEVDANAMIKFGSAIDPDLEGRMRVSVVATGIDVEEARARPPMPEPQSAREPTETDPGILTAIRGRRPPEQPAARRDSAHEPPQETPAATPGFAGTEPDPAPRPLHDRPVHDAPVHDAPVNEERPAAQGRDEPRHHVAPLPAEIQARADKVRQRADEARAHREEARDGFVEPVLSDIDERSLDPGAVCAARPQPEPRAEDPAQGRGGRFFAINKLIHLVAGANGHEERPERREPSTVDAPRPDEDPGEIPAFLRRQAN